MKDLKLPFSTFDMLVTMIPAIIFIGGAIVLFPKSNTELMVGALVEAFASLKNLHEIVYYSFMGLFVTSVIFAVGHIILAIGSLLIDRFLIGQSTGYPYAQLLQVKQDCWETLKSQFYMALSGYTCITLVVLLFFPSANTFYVYLPCVSMIIAKVYVSRQKKEIYGIGKLYLHNKNGNAKISEEQCLKVKKWRKIIIRCSFFTFFLYIPIKEILRFVRTSFRMHSFDADFGVELLKAFEGTYGSEDFNTNNISDSSLFWLPYIDIHENCPSVAQSLSAIRVMYYFCRNLAMSFFLLTGVAIIAQLIDKKDISIALKGLFCYMIGWLFFVQYYNIFHNHYTKQTFRAFFVYYKSKQRQEKIGDGLEEKIKIEPKVRNKTKKVIPRSG